MTELKYDSTTTLRRIREGSPESGRACKESYIKLLKFLGKTKADDEPVTLLQVLDSNGLDDALWVLSYVMPEDRLARHFRAWCAEQVLHVFEAELPGDSRVRDQIDMLRNDSAKAAARAAAQDAAKAAAKAAAGRDAQAAARVAVWGDAWDSARSAQGVAQAAAKAAAWDAAWDSLRTATWESARAAKWEAARAMWDAAWDSAIAASWDASKAAGRFARDSQEDQLRKMLGEHT
ncbi:hypothetical protein MACH17_18110 [Phaeobacter inhibens]|uniref:hypothetical protein n=1 Tax=Phaeobacter inhibens TaxID=221822 RepID=UPI0027473804|nr:hypothetical protein [Phaeobacter inhibens]GLO70294.1 hypothetical protein MACH17_18110 [Phaeobacter inhibens]